MLTRDGHNVRLPQNDLAYLAFRLALQETLADIESYLHLEEDEDTEPPVGYLTEVPFLEQVPLRVQVDLLADTWSRHRRPALSEASLLDAAVIYTACVTARRVIKDMPDVATAWGQNGPVAVPGKITRGTARRLARMFDHFWDDRDFLLIDDLLDLPPDRSSQIKERLGLPDAVLAPMYEALGRWNVSRDLAERLEGLLTEAEIRGAMPLLTAEAGMLPRATKHALPEVRDQILFGIEDRYHNIRVGPCDAATAEAECRCPLVQLITVTSADDFVCTYQEWVEHLRAGVHQAAEQEPAQE